MSENRCILVVDDDADCCAMVSAILSSKGFQPEVCLSGREAFEKLKTIKPAMIILDIMMPEMSGYDVVVRLKQKPETQNIPVMMLSAKSEPEDLITGYKDYAVEYYITKPFTTHQLIAGIKLVLGYI